MTEIAKLTIENTTPFRRRDIPQLGLTFDQGVLEEHDGIRDDQGRACVVEPFGAPWPDGSVRFARAWLPVEVGASSTLVTSLHRGQGRVERFVQTPTMLETYRLARFSIGATGPAGGVAFDHPWTLDGLDHLRYCCRQRVRVPNTPLWAELRIQYFSGLDFQRFTLVVVNSDPRDPKVTHQIPKLIWRLEGVIPVIWHAAVKRHDIAGSYQQGFTVTLDPGGPWGDGQALYLEGCLLNPGLEADVETLKAENQGWPLYPLDNEMWQGRFGPWGATNAMPWLTRQAAAASAKRDYEAHTVGDPWSWSALGCAPDPQGTGDQRDFGATPMHAEARGFWTRLHCGHLSMLQEGCRPTHKIEVDDTPLDWARHPKALIWNGVVDTRIAGDTLGKAATVTTSQTRRAKIGIPWYGHGREHWSINHLAGFFLMTGNELAERELRHQVGLWMNGCTIGSASPVLNGMGADRDVGRTLQTAIWLWLCTGDVALQARILERVQVVKAQWRGRNTAPVRPGTVRSPDGRNLGGLYSFWMPWQQAIGAGGLDAVAVETGDPDARFLADEWAKNVLSYGIFLVGSRYRASKATEWQQGGQWNGWQEFTGAADGPTLAGLPAVPDRVLTIDEMAVGLAALPPEALGLEALEKEQDYNVADAAMPAPQLVAADAGQPNMVEFYDPYLLWMLPAIRICERIGHEPTKVSGCLGQMGLPGTKNERVIEWAAIR